MLMRAIMVMSLTKGNTMTKSNKTNETPQSPKLQIKESLIGILTLGVIVAESIATYVLYFSGQTTSLKIVAGVLIADAAVRAGKAFTVVK